MEDGVRHPLSVRDNLTPEAGMGAGGKVGSGWVKSWDKHRRRLVVNGAELLVFPPWDFTPQSAQISEIRAGTGGA